MNAAACIVGVFCGNILSMRRPGANFRHYRLIRFGMIARTCSYLLVALIVLGLGCMPILHGDPGAIFTDQIAATGQADHDEGCGDPVGSGSCCTMIGCVLLPMAAPDTSVLTRYEVRFDWHSDSSSSRVVAPARKPPRRLPIA
ncbi:MAG: hypothetical protein KDE35_13405 [Geminicoccaceae bacterium]|nr:hypothetical protein [Geminicoccaceae bacterium]